MAKIGNTQLDSLLNIVEKYSELSNGYSLRLPNKSPIIKQASGIIAKERLGRPTLTFSLEVTANNETWLTVTGGPADKEYLKKNIIERLNSSENKSPFLTQYSGFFRNDYARLGFWGISTSIVCCLIPAFIGAFTATSIASYFVYLDYLLAPIFIVSLVILIVGYRQYYKDSSNDNIHNCNC